LLARVVEQRLSSKAQDPGSGNNALVVHRAGKWAIHPHDLVIWAGDDLQVHAMPTLLSE
jgi:hypothetical protein